MTHIDDLALVECKLMRYPCAIGSVMLLEVEMIVKAVFIAAFLLIGEPVEAGGLFGDVLVKHFDPGAAAAWDSANKRIGDAINAPDTAPGPVPPASSLASSTCLTAVGSCPLSAPALNGTTCFCEFNSQTVFGSAH